jgi:hypothetical protein
MRWLAASISILALSVACHGGDDNITSFNNSAATVAGTWSLRSIGGATLPVVLDQVGEDKLELLSAALAMQQNGNFTSSSTQRTTISGQVNTQSFSENGTFDVQGTSVLFTFTTDGSVVTGTFRGDSLTFDGGGVAVVYRRQ